MFFATAGVLFSAALKSARRAMTINEGGLLQKKMRTKEENCLIYTFYGHLFITKLGFDDFNICKRMVQPF